MQFVTPSKKFGPNLKLYYERFFSEFYENSKQKLCSTKMTEQTAVFLSKFIFFNRKRLIILILVVFDHIIIWASRSVTLLCAPDCPLIILYIGTQYQSLSPKIYVLVVKQDEMMKNPPKNRFFYSNFRLNINISLFFYEYL